MSTAKNTCGWFDRQKIERLQKEYKRLNPHNLPSLKRRARIAKTPKYERVYSVSPVLLSMA